MLDRFVTLMIIPERQKGVKSIRIPRLIFRSMILILGVSFIVLGIFAYDYWKIIQQVFENKHLSIENRQLREQIQLFQMKINSLSNEIERVENFEKKLRVITGLENFKNSESPETSENTSKNNVPDQSINIKSYHSNEIDTKNPFKNKDFLFNENPKFQQLQKLYEQKLASSFGMLQGYEFSKDFSQLTKNSFQLANTFAVFDIKYDFLKNKIGNLESSIHEIDTFLLDRKSFLRSTPTLMPVSGWVTSYYGPRISPISEKLRMHEGIDIGARSGSWIVAPADGVVTFAGSKPGFGNFISIDHGYGIETAYAHAKKIVVKSGQKVSRGVNLASVGNTGYSTGPHLHYEVRVNGTPVDPLYYILEDI